VSTSIILYNFQIPRLVPQLKSALFDTQSFPSVLGYGYAIVTLLFGLIAVLGYLITPHMRFNIILDNITVLPQVKPAVYVLILVAAFCQHGDVVRSCQHSWSNMLKKDEFEEEEDEDDIPLASLARLYLIRFLSVSTTFAAAYFSPNKLAWVRKIPQFIVSLSRQS
jgi:hypothetical protein